jgi:hypothetical protein
MFEKYDSSEFPTLEESIASAASNPFICNNFSRKVQLTYQGTVYTISEPLSVLKQFLDDLSDYFETQNLPESEYYQPEASALRIYGSRDFWFLIMLQNNVFSVTEYKIPTITFISADQLFRIEKFLLKTVEAPTQIGISNNIFQ